MLPKKIIFLPQKTPYRKPRFRKLGFRYSLRAGTWKIVAVHAGTSAAGVMANHWQCVVEDMRWRSCRGGVWSRQPLTAKCDASNETPAGRLRSRGNRVIESAAKRSIFSGTKPRPSPVRQDLRQCGVWIVEDTVQKVILSRSSSARYHGNAAAFLPMVGPMQHTAYLDDGSRLPGA